MRPCNTHTSAGPASASASSASARMLGPLTPEPESFAIMDKAIDLGFNFFDTADVYGWKQGEGSPSKSSADGLPRGGRAAADVRKW